MLHMHDMEPLSGLRPGCRAEAGKVSDQGFPAALPQPGDDPMLGLLPERIGPVENVVTARGALDGAAAFVPAGPDSQQPLPPEGPAFRLSVVRSMLRAAAKSDRVQPCWA